MYLRFAATLMILWLMGPSGCAPLADHVEDDSSLLSTSEPAAEEPEPPRIDWASVSDCQGKLGLLQQGMNAGHIETLETTPFALISGQQVSGWPRLGQQDLQASANASGDQAKRCIIRLGEVRDHKSEHRSLGRERVRSSYQSGSRMEKNPAYEAAQVRLRQAERANKPGKSSIISVGDPLIDLIGMVVGGAITGLTQWGEGDPVEEAIENLMATPRSIEKPTYRSYQFERTRFRASREAIMPVIMTDRQLRQSWRVSLKRREVRDIAVLDGLDRQDRDYPEHRDGGMTGQEFRQWQAEPPELPLEDMIASLLGDGIASASADRIASLDDAADEPAMFDESNVADAAALPRAVGGSMSSMRQPIAPIGAVAGSSAIRHASIVEIVGQESRGRGAYVAPAFVLVGSELVEGQGLIDIEYGLDGDGYGSRVLGLVAAVDRSRGLALVQVPRAGVPVVLEAGWSRPSEWPDRASRGRSDRSAVTGESGPILDGPYLLGFQSERGPDISLREIKAFLYEQEALLGSGVTAASGAHSPGSKVFSKHGDRLSRR